MKDCPRCHTSNADSLDFCERCGEFLDWGADGGNGNGSRAATASGVVRTVRLATVTRRSTEQVTLDVFRADQPGETGAVEVSVPAGGRVTLGARVGNQSDIVDAYTLTVVGLPDGWWTIDPSVAYLMPSPSDGHSEDVAIAVHPPRTPDAVAGRWTFDVVVTSQSDPTRSARATVAVDVEPFWQLAAAARPAVATSLRHAVLSAEVSNMGNAPVPVLLAGADAENRCRIDVPAGPVQVPPGDPVPIGVGVRAKRPRLIGRPRDHHLELEARDADGHAQSVKFLATYRQRAWLPWWLPLLLLLLALAALLVYLLWPAHRVKVPELVKLPSAFAAQKRLEKDGLTLSPNVRQEPRRDVKPGSVIDQAPAPGTHVAKGKAVSVVVASRPGKVKVPKLRGLRVTSADQRLQRAGLTLGAVVPKIEPNARVGGQVPEPGVMRDRGSPVNVTLAPPKKPKKKAAAAGAKPVPAVAGGSAAAAAAAVQAAGLKPVTKLQIDPAKRGTVIATSPAQGQPPPKDRIVTLTVSAGFPRLAYDSGGIVFAVGGVGGRPPIGVARHAAVTSGAAWSPDGRKVAYVSSGQLFVVKPGSGGSPGPVGIGSGRTASQVAFAPFRRRTIMAFADHHRGGDALCWLDLTGGINRGSHCKRLPGWRIDGIVWRPDGKELLVPASGEGRFGLLRLTNPVPFSTVAQWWSGGVALATPNRDGRGVLAAAFSPDGKRLAVVANLQTGDFRVAIVRPGNLALAKVKAQDYLPVQGCDVAWRSDGLELAVVQSGAQCVKRVGPVVRFQPAHPRSRRTVVALGEHPSWQPVDLNPGPRR